MGLIAGPVIIAGIAEISASEAVRTKSSKGSVDFETAGSFTMEVEICPPPFRAREIEFY